MTDPLPFWPPWRTQRAGSRLGIQRTLAALFHHVGLVTLNGFFVATEFAIVKVRASQLRGPQGPRGSRGAKCGAPARESSSMPTLSATQLGITLASLGLGWVGEPYFAALLQPLFFKIGITSETAIHTLSVVLAFAAITSCTSSSGNWCPSLLPSASR